MRCNAEDNNDGMYCECASDSARCSEASAKSGSGPLGVSTAAALRRDSHTAARSSGTSDVDARARRASIIISMSAAVPSDYHKVIPCSIL